MVIKFFKKQFGSYLLFPDKQKRPTRLRMILQEKSANTIINILQLYTYEYIYFFKLFL